MAVTTSLAGSTRTVTFIYSADNTKVLALMTDAAKWLYIVKGRYHVTIMEGTPPNETTRDKTWDELTSAEKLSVLDQGVRDGMLQWANAYYLNAELPAAQATIITTGNATYDI